MKRLTVELSDQEWVVLQRKAKCDLRSLRDQARFLIARGLAAEVSMQSDAGVVQISPTLPHAEVTR